MSTDILDSARAHLLDSLKEKHNRFESRHPWRKDWEFAVLHSLRVESYTLKILARENHSLAEHEIILLRLAAILHDLARLDIRENHGRASAEMAKKWFQDHPEFSLPTGELKQVLEMIADHSNKGVYEPDFSKAVLKDADTLDEIGVMSIMMTTNWLDKQTPFFFYDLRKRLVEFELPFCDEQSALLNTHGAKEILSEKKAFVENFLAQLSDELQTDGIIEQLRPDWFQRNVF